MKLFENPVFLTHKRIVHRGGVLAAILIAALVGSCLLAGLISYLADPRGFNFSSPAEAGKTFYGWIVGVEILVLILGGFNRVARALADDRKAGLWDSNRLTPLKPAQILAGYWLAPALREVYMAAVLAGFGLVIVLAGRLPITLWLGTQVLIVSTALLFGLLALLAGMALQRSQGVLIFLGLFFAYPFSFIAPSRMLTNFLLPIYGITNLFHEPAVAKAHHSANEWADWRVLPEIFGVQMQPILLSLALQILLGLFVWRVLVRKTNRPFQPLLLRGEAITLFSMLVLSQHALLWDLWYGKFPVPDDKEGLLAVVYGGAILISLTLLAMASPKPEHVRIEALRLGFKNTGAIFSRSAVSLAFTLAGISAAAFFTQFVFSLASSFKIFLALAVNLLEICLVFALLLEFCRLRHKRRALGFVALWLFLFGLIPFILAAVFSSETIGRFSLLAPGFMAMSNHQNPDWPCLFGILLAHLGITVILFIGWQRQWKRLLEHTA